MKPTQSKTELYWLTAFLIIPMLCAKAFGDAYTADKGMKFLYSALAGGLGGMLGFVAYYFTSKRPVPLRAAALLALIIVTVVPTVLVGKAGHATNAAATNASHSTCPVCGYIAFDVQEKSCDNCGEVLTEDELRESGYSSMDSLIQLSQLYHFIPDDEDAAVSFVQPAISADGYTLDESWKPSVSKAEVEKQAVEYYEFRRKHPVKVEVIRKQQE